MTHKESKHQCMVWMRAVWEGRREYLFSTLYHLWMRCDWLRNQTLVFFLQVRLMHALRHTLTNLLILLFSFSFFFFIFLQFYIFFQYERKSIKITKMTSYIIFFFIKWNSLEYNLNNHLCVLINIYLFFIICHFFFFLISDAMMDLN